MPVIDRNSITEKIQNPAPPQNGCLQDKSCTPCGSEYKIYLVLRMIGQNSRYLINQVCKQQRSLLEIMSNVIFIIALLFLVSGCSRSVTKLLSTGHFFIVISTRGRNL
jgi:hypothetical protein